MTDWLIQNVTGIIGLALGGYSIWQARREDKPHKGDSEGPPEDT